MIIYKHFFARNRYSELKVIRNANIRIIIKFCWLLFTEVSPEPDKNHYFDEF